MDDFQDTGMSEARKRLAKLSRHQNRMAGANSSYSSFVRRLRLILPLVAIAIIAALMTWPAQERQIAVLQQEQKQSLQNIRKNELSNPRFQSVDDKNQPYNITADKAIQASDDENILTLTMPVADMLLNSGSWIAIKSVDGTYWQEDEKLLLKNKVRLFHDDGYEMGMEELNIDLKTRTAISQTPVNGHGPAGTIQAAGLSGDNALGILAFTGPAKLVLKDAGSFDKLSGARKEGG